MTVPSPPQRPEAASGATTVVTTEVGPGVALAVLVRDGCAELGRAGLLAGAARGLVLALGPAAGEAEAARWLLARGAADEASARADARRFLAELERLAPSPSAVSEARGPRSGERTEPQATLAEPEAWTRLARGVPSAGHRLPLRPHGRSTRPLVPHGSLLAAEPRAFQRVRLG